MYNKIKYKKHDYVTTLQKDFHTLTTEEAADKVSTISKQVKLIVVNSQKH